MISALFCDVTQPIMIILYHYTLCNITEERKPNLLRGIILKSNIEVFVFLECYAAKFGRWLLNFRQNLLVPSLKAKINLIPEAELEG